jgi:hypothetical protein
MVGLPKAFQPRVTLEQARFYAAHFLLDKWHNVPVVSHGI